MNNIPLNEILLKIFSSLDFNFSKISFLNFFVWINGLIFVFLFFFSFFNYVSKKGIFSNMIVNWFSKSCKSVWFNYSFSFFFLTSFVFMLFLASNFWGLVPYIFGFTSQIFFVLNVSFIAWLTVVSFGSTWLFFSFVSHLVPQGSPFALSFFLSSIEFVSNIIRPLTLALRLSINITTGHIFITLMSVGLCSMLLSKSFISLFFLGLILSFYYAFEFAICVIQAFVFGLLIIQYVEENSFVH